MYNERILSVKNDYARAWLKSVWRDMHVNNMGFFAVNTGHGGMGKSLSTNTYNFFLDMEYDVDALEDFWCRDIMKYLRRIDECEKRMITFDDAGTSRTLSSKNWMKLTNILVEDTTQVMRIKYNGSTIISQNVAFIDNRIRSLFQWFIETYRNEKNPAFMKIHKIRVNQIKQQLSFPYPLFRMPDGHMVRLTGIKMEALPPGRIRDKFEELDKEFKHRVLKEDAERAEKIMLEDNPKDIWEMIESVENDIEKYTNKKGKIDPSLIMPRFNVGRSRADQIIKLIEKNLNR